MSARHSRVGALRSILGVAGCALALGAFVTSDAVAAAATPNWTGIWTRVGSLNFDPTIPGNKNEDFPYNAKYQEFYDRIIAAEAKGLAINDKSADCQPPGIVRMMAMVYPMEILQTPGQVTIIAEWEGQIRRIFTDGRPHPQDPDPTYNGHSIGRWEGETLLVDTVGILGEGIINDHGAPLGEQVHVTEKWWAEGPDTLKNEITVESPDALTRPIKAVKTFKRRNDIQIMEYVCTQNNRNQTNAEGVTGIELKKR
jgi:hypothetical protein